MCHHPDVTRQSPRGASAVACRHVSAHGVNVAATVVLLFGKVPDQWQAAQRPSITPGARCASQEAEIPILTPPIASLAESFVDGHVGRQNPSRGYPCRELLVKLWVRGLAQRSEELLMPFPKGGECYRGATSFLPTGLFGEHCGSQGPSIPTRVCHL